MEPDQNFDELTPDPNILFVLTNTPLKAIDALCELIDNALDSFTAAKIRGLKIDQRWVRIEIPTRAQVTNGFGKIRVIDNGGGLDREGLKGALRAGFSSKNKYSSLGLFGVGFNIATGKFGQVTEVTTGRMDDKGRLEETGLKATLDMPRMKRDNSWRVPIEVVARPERGTTVEVSGWWPAGSPNANFALELARMSKSRILENLGRRYATILLDPERRVNITVNGDLVTPFEHCVWSEKRSVKRAKLGEFPAMQKFDKVLKTTRRCSADGSELAVGEDKCPNCGGSQITPLEERVRGWIGVQRFDSQSEYGIDLIRNGRAIRVLEKDAFFTYTGKDGASRLEYPISPPAGYGRIVGEVHLDHVPVDYAKQDFQRSTREWDEAIKFIRGDALTKREEGTRNESPLGRIHDGFYANRRPGVEYMSMGEWTPTGPTRISRDEEQKMYAKFLKKEDGFYDDEKWWERVLNADRRPSEPLRKCPECEAEFPDGIAECPGCAAIIEGKDCLGCGVRILKTADICPSCGANQRISISGPWSCERCSWQNGPEDQECGQCALGRGEPNPMSLEALTSISTKIDELSFDSVSFKRLDGKPAQPVTVSTYSVPKDKLRPFFNQPPVPTFAPSGNQLGKIEIFIDRQHVLFTEMGVMPEVAVSIQVASFLQAVGSSSNGQSVMNIAHIVLSTVFGERLSTNQATVGREVEALLSGIVRTISALPWSSELQDELTSEEREVLVEKLNQSGQLSEFERTLNSAGFIQYVPRALARSYREDYQRWTGTVFIDEIAKLQDYAPAVAKKLAEQNRHAVLRALEECAEFVDSPAADIDVLRRVKSSVAYLNARLI